MAEGTLAASPALLIFEEIQMSFPSAVERHNAGDSPKASLIHAMRTDTKLGYDAIMAIAQAARSSKCPCCTLKSMLPEEHHKDILRKEYRGRGVIVDFPPDSIVGKQIARLLGTDAARPLMIELAGMPLGFANCCKVLASLEEEDVRFSIEDQIRWQENIDC